MGEQQVLPDTWIGNEVSIREFYNGFVPPRYVRRLVSRLLFSVPPKYMVGLDAIVLMNQSGAPRRWRLGKVTSRKRRFPQDRVLGRYHHAHKGRPAWIELYIDKLVAGVSQYRLIPFVRTAIFGKVLFHEIGHHVHATVRPEFREKEDVADNWGRKLMANYFRTHYWYVPKRAWKIIAFVMKAIQQSINLS
jgi:hypothetical protein